MLSSIHRASSSTTSEGTLWLFGSRSGNEYCCSLRAGMVTPPLAYRPISGELRAVADYLLDWTVAYIKCCSFLGVNERTWKWRTNMLRGMLLHPEILEAIAGAGHGSQILIADG